MMHHVEVTTGPPKRSLKTDGTRATVASSAIEAPSLPDDPRIGTVLDDRYLLERCLGQGGMGLVYQAQHVFLKTRVAVKVLRPEVDDPGALERLQREAQSASAIGNPHIVDVRDFGTTKDGSTYVVMEMIEGENLLEEIRRHRISWRRARGIAQQVTEALGAAHDQGVVHRDLKPENILLTVRERVSDFVKVVDFGIARMHGAKKLTAAGEIVGTPEYMAPEQCAGLAVDNRADIYALGILLYEMLTQHLPFSDPDVVELLRKQLRAAPVPPRERAPEAEIPEGLEEVVLRCLEKRPSRRFQSMAEVAEALDTLVAGESADNSVDDDPARGLLLDASSEASQPLASPRDAQTAVAAPPPAPAGRSRSRRAWVVAAVGLPGVIGLATLAIYARGGGEGAAPAVGTAATTAAERSDDAERPAQIGPAQIVPGHIDPARNDPARIERGRSARGPSAQPPAEQIVLTSDPPHARVYEGDALIGETPLPIRRPDGDGRRELTLRHRSHRDERIVVGARTGESVNIVLRRTRRPRRPAGGTGAAQTPAPERPRPAGGEARETPPPERTSPTRPAFLDPWR